MKISLIFCLVVVVVLASCIFILLKYYEKLRSQYESLKESYSHVERLNAELRGSVMII